MKAPEHIVEKYGTTRRWKALKRLELRDAYAALTKLRNGCAFFPCGAGPISRAQKELEAVYDAICEKNWGR
jgi:hypothetical protein